MVAQIDHQYLEDVAANTEYTLDELTEVSENLVSVLQLNLADHYERTKLQNGRDNWLMEYDREGVWLAFTRGELLKMLRGAGHDPDPELVYAVGFASLLYFQDNGRTLKIPGVISRSLKDPFFVPIYVPYSGQFLEGMEYALYQLQRYLMRYQLSPAEALDYWATQRMGMDMTAWARRRKVGTEAVRKNVRQAREKLKPVSPDRKARQKIRAVPVEEIPEDKPHDEGHDYFYIPDQDALDGYPDDMKPASR